MRMRPTSPGGKARPVSSTASTENAGATKPTAPTIGVVALRRRLPRCWLGSSHNRNSGCCRARSEFDRTTPATAGCRRCRSLPGRTRTAPPARNSRQIRRPPPAPRLRPGLCTGRTPASSRSGPTHGIRHAAARQDVHHAEIAKGRRKTGNHEHPRAVGHRGAEYPKVMQDPIHHHSLAESDRSRIPRVVPDVSVIRRGDRDRRRGEPPVPRVRCRRP